MALIVQGLGVSMCFGLCHMSSTGARTVSLTGADASLSIFPDLQELEVLKATCNATLGSPLLEVSFGDACLILLRI